VARTFRGFFKSKTVGLSGRNKTPNAFAVGAVDFAGEHGRAGSGGYLLCGGVAESLESTTLKANGETGLGAELTDTKSDRVGEGFGDPLGFCVKGAGQKKNRIDAAHLCVKGDGLGAICGGSHETAAALARTGEADGLDSTISNERLADLVALADEKREDAFREATFGDCCLNGSSHKLGSSEMQGMSFRDHGTAGSEG
jgi:hypothetical protein